MRVIQTINFFVLYNASAALAFNVVSRELSTNKWTAQRTRLSCVPVEKEDDQMISRRKAIQSGLYSILAFSTIVPNVAKAAIPTMDDYENTQNGAQIVSSSQLTQAQQMMIQTFSQKQAIENKQSLLELSDKISDSLTTMEPLVKTADWVAIRSVLRAEGRYDGNVLGMARKPYFGLGKSKAGGQKALQSVLGAKVDVAVVEDAREDLAFSLSLLEDFALENRSIFFNSLDRKQVEELIAETGFTEKLSEGNELLNAAKVSVTSFKKVVMTL